MTDKTEYGYIEDGHPLTRQGLDSTWVVLTVIKGTLPNSTEFITEQAARAWAEERALNRSGERVFLAHVVYECVKTGVEWKKLP